MDNVWAHYEKVTENGKLLHVNCVDCGTKVSAKAIRMRNHRDKCIASASMCGTPKTNMTIHETVQVRITITNKNSVG